MTTLHALILGMVQGLTEFFPVSSTGHLILAQTLLGIPSHPKDDLAMIILLHAGTLLALLLCYMQTWWSLLSAPFRGDRRQSRMLMILIIATVPVGVIGFLFKDVIANAAESSTVLATEFFINGCILILGEAAVHPEGFFSRTFRRILPSSSHSIGVPAAIGIGFAQALALSPALSRSGLTITAGRFAGLSRREALDFSFLMATPAIAGAVTLMIVDVLSGGAQLPASDVSVAGFIASFLASVFAILFLRAFASRYSFSWFAIYLFFLSGFVLMR